MTKLAFHISLVPSTYRDLNTGKQRRNNPASDIDNRLKGINFTYKKICEPKDTTRDSRHLYEFEIQENDLDENAYSTQNKLDLKDVIIERLAMHSPHEKSSITSAKSLAEDLTGLIVNITGTGDEQTLDVQWPSAV